MARKRKIEKDYHELAKSRGFKWVNKILPKNTHYKTLWECEKGHKWFASYNHLNRGRGCCPVCLKASKEDYYKLAAIRGFMWVGKEIPKNVLTKTLWECKKGHRWLSRYNDVYNGNGCSVCRKNTIQDYNTVGKNKNIKWAGKEIPKNIRIKTWWECENGHRWEALYNSIKQGSGCPHCQNRVHGVLVSDQQIRLNNLLYGSLNYIEGRYCIDVVIIKRSQKIAVEYDCQYWHQGREEHDTKRDGFLISCGWKILHIKSKALLPEQKQLKAVINCLLNSDNKVYNLYLEDWK